jgi:hypothetical protein
MEKLVIFSVSFFLYGLHQGVTQRCRLPLLINTAPNTRGGGGVVGSQPMSTAVHIT